MLRYAKHAKYLLAGSAGLGLILFFVPWVSLGLPLGDEVLPETMSGASLHQWGLLFRLLLLAGAGGLAVARGFDRRIGFLALVLALVTFVDLLSLWAWSSSMLGSAGDAGMAAGFFFELLLALAAGAAGLGALLAPEELRLAIPIVDRYFPPMPAVSASPQPGPAPAAASSSAAAPAPAILAPPAAAVPPVAAAPSAAAAAPAVAIPPAAGVPPGGHTVFGLGAPPALPHPGAAPPPGGRPPQGGSR